MDSRSSFFDSRSKRLANKGYKFPLSKDAYLDLEDSELQQRMKYLVPIVVIISIS